MRRSLVTVLAGIVLAGTASADCAGMQNYGAIARIATKGGGTYSYGVVVGGDAGMRGTLTGAPNGLPEVTFDLHTPYHMDVAGAGLARLLAPKATAAEPAGTDLTVVFSPNRRLPKAVPGKDWSGKFSATVFARGPDDYNRRPIGEAVLSGSYRFLDEISAEFDGCTHRIQPVELTLTYKGQTALSRRILYFPRQEVVAITGWGPDADGPARKTGITRIAPE